MKIIIGIIGFMLSSSFAVNAAVTDTEWKVGTQCLEEAGLPPHKLLCMKIEDNQLQAIMRAGFLIGTKTRQLWCNLVDKLGLQASADDAHGKEGMADRDTNDNYKRAFKRGSQVVRCMTEKVFTDYNQWGLLATHLYYCGELNSSGDCVAATVIAKQLRGMEPECKTTGSLWKWTQGSNFTRLSLDSIYDDHCNVKAKKMVSYCESIIKDKTQCKSLYGTK